MASGWGEGGRELGVQRKIRQGSGNSLVDKAIVGVKTKERNQRKNPPTHARTRDETINIDILETIASYDAIF